MTNKALLLSFLSLLLLSSSCIGATLHRDPTTNPDPATRTHRQRPVQHVSLVTPRLVKEPTTAPSSLLQQFQSFISLQSTAVQDDETACRG